METINNYAERIPIYVIYSIPNGIVIKYLCVKIMRPFQMAAIFRLLPNRIKYIILKKQTSSSQVTLRNILANSPLRWAYILHNMF